MTDDRREPGRQAAFYDLAKDLAVNTAETRENKRAIDTLTKVVHDQADATRTGLRMVSDTMNVRLEEVNREFKRIGSLVVDQYETMRPILDIHRRKEERRAWWAERWAGARAKTGHWTILAIGVLAAGLITSFATGIYSWVSEHAGWLHLPPAGGNPT